MKRDKSNIKNNHLKKLISEREKYRHIIEKLFDGSTELSETEKNLYIQQNIEDIKRMMEISDKIANLKINLMSEEEKTMYLNKYSNK